MIVNTPKLGALGLFKDQNPIALPPGGLTVANNVRFTGSSIERSGAWQVSPEDLATDNIHARKLHRHIRGDGVEELYIMEENGEMHVTTGSNPSDVSPTYTNTSGTAHCSSCSLALIPYFSADDHPVAGRATGGGNFSLIMAGTDHADSMWRVIRAYKDRLFCCNETTGSSEHPQRVLWSGPVGSEEVATDWDSDGADSTSGWVDLTTLNGEILDAAVLGEYLYVFASQGVARMWESGDDYIFDNAPVVSADGVLSTNCVTEIPGKGLFVVGRNHIYLFDGQQAHPIALDRVEQWFRDDVDTDQLTEVFVYADTTRGEVWVCYHSLDDTVYFAGVDKANRALIWDYRHNVWSTRDIPNLADLVTWSVEYTAETWTTTPNNGWHVNPDSWASTGGNAVPVPYGVNDDYTINGTSIDEGLVWFDPTAYPDDEYNNNVSAVGRSHINLADVGMTPWAGKLMNKFHVEWSTVGASADAPSITIGVGINGKAGYEEDTTVTYTPITDPWQNTRLFGHWFGYSITATDDEELQLSDIFFDIDVIAGK